jgi:hypothetical protein
MSAFDYDIPFDIMVGYWVGTASIYCPKGTYLMSTKSYVSVYWTELHNQLSFRESAEDDLAFTGAELDYVDPRDMGKIAQTLQDNNALAANSAANSVLRVLQYDLTVEGPYCHGGDPSTVSLTGRQTRPDVYQFHVRKKEKEYNPSIDYDHHVYNSHHLPSPDDWHIIGPIVGRIGDEGGRVGLAVAQFFRRISYKVPKQTVVPMPPNP